MGIPVIPPLFVTWSRKRLCCTVLDIDGIDLQLLRTGQSLWSQALSYSLLRNALISCFTPEFLQGPTLDATIRRTWRIHAGYSQVRLSFLPFQHIPWTYLLLRRDWACSTLPTWYIKYMWENCNFCKKPCHAWGIFRLLDFDFTLITQMNVDKHPSSE
jgi:hypothetical protein